MSGSLGMLFTPSLHHLCRMMKSIVSIIAFVSTSFAQNSPSPTILSCGGSLNLSSFTISPKSPQAGDTVTLNATGILNGVGSLTGGTGAISAYLFGLDVFDTTFNTCGETQIDVDGMATGILDGPSCPLSKGQKGALGFYLPIPEAAAGLGQLQIILNATDSNKVPAYCANLTITL